MTPLVMTPARRAVVFLLAMLLNGACSRADQGAPSAHTTDAASSVPSTDREKLVHACLDLAEKLLREQGGAFYPFALTIDANGQLAILASAPPGEPPRSSEVLDLLEQSLRAGARSGQYRATAVVVLLHPTASSDVMSIRFEHREGESSETLVAIEADGGQFGFGKRAVTPSVAFIFAH